MVDNKFKDVALFKLDTHSVLIHVTDITFTLTGKSSVLAL